MDAPGKEFALAGSLEELKIEGRLVVRGGHRPILVIYDRGRVFALDNRCPHMGFPLERGSVEDGILTCHWHHARFDLESGCTFDLWADDVPICPIEVRDGDVWVKTTQADPAAHWHQRLANGLAHDLSLVIAKAVHGQLAAGVPQGEIVRQVALFGAQNRDGWGVGLTILTALANLLPVLPEEEAYLALFQGARRVAADCDGEAPRRERAPLGSRPDPAALKRWLRRWTNVRHREAAERTLLTAIAAGFSPAEFADALFAAATDRAFADTGHSLDFVNKAFECLDLVGWQHAAALLPTVVGQMVAARGAEESTAWRQPVDLVALCEESGSELADLFAAGRGARDWSGHAALAQELLGDDPARIVAALKRAIRAGGAPADLGQSLAYAAALRVARFGNANEHADWETAHHVFTYANAVHQMLTRIGTASIDTHVTAVRGVLHGAMALYLARYLNVPPARIPGDGGEQLNDLPADPKTIGAALLDAFDRQRQVDLAARLVARHLTLGHSPQPLIAALARAVLREDAGFHAYQMLEAGARQFGAWGDVDAGRHILIAVARYLAAHSPTERAFLQTADIARRLMRGGELHQEAGLS
ncbi:MULTISPECIES: Rieske (2Fe-2S) protein [unclassified Bradyrhizobium]|uniref:Rieske (2Fe-2S) protein n=1 Tax=unclassified Bradyrhizobium TaxID=2631580 RepID=UPI002478776A|nr:MULTISPECIES: Rieske (2Fe-2S) protein [unclassified Bradyrhizobium]WGR70261.1 Rieske (2Fe-2S) protein [Bradyrhizobium sp. ISRA426]WGR82320.1 Rieske (2Fe-2S) protein [Bradyrhizobium sp. ISRA430]WGR85505.1 Rieske (2Fe-2S) protein [Bradyrhizobium sp. ISRA432]